MTDNIAALLAEIARLRAQEVPLSANVGFVGITPCDSCDETHFLSNGDVPYVTVDEVNADFPKSDVTTVALIPITAWDRA